MFRRYTLATVICLVLYLVSFSQSGHWGMSLSPGIMFYQGEMSPDFPSFKTSHFSIGLDVSYSRGSILTFSLGYLYGKISGADSLIPGKEERNLHFYSHIHDFHFLTNIDLVSVFRKFVPLKTVDRVHFERSFTGPDLILGFGIVRFNPKGEYEGKSYDLQKLGTEGQYISSGGYDSPYGLWQLSIKYGLGFGYNVSRQINIAFQIIYNQVFTDYLDDVSGEYPDYNELLKTENGEVASYFTYGGRDGSKVRSGQLRGNSVKNDGYYNVAFKVTYTFSRSELKRIMNL